MDPATPAPGEPAALPPLSRKQSRFVDEYLVDLNGTQAAIRAGYSPHTACEQAAQLLAKLNIREVVERRSAERTAERVVLARRVLEEMMLLAFGDVALVLDMSGPEPRLRPANEIPPEGRRMISSIEVKRTLEGRGEDAREVEVVKFRFWSKPQALEMVGRICTMFKDQFPGTDVDSLRLTIEALMRARREAQEWHEQLRNGHANGNGTAHEPGGSPA